LGWVGVLRRRVAGQSREGARGSFGFTRMVTAPATEQALGGSASGGEGHWDV
jgi:hypothetical protein